MQLKLAFNSSSTHSELHNIWGRDILSLYLSRVQSQIHQISAPCLEMTSFTSQDFFFLFLVCTFLVYETSLFCDLKTAVNVRNKSDCSVLKQCYLRIVPNLAKGSQDVQLASSLTRLSTSFKDSGSIKHLMKFICMFFSHAASMLAEYICFFVFFSTA